MYVIVARACILQRRREHYYTSNFFIGNRIQTGSRMLLFLVTLAALMPQLIQSLLLFLASVLIMIGTRLHVHALFSLESI